MFLFLFVLLICSLDDIKTTCFQPQTWAGKHELKSMANTALYDTVNLKKNMNMKATSDVQFAKAAACYLLLFMLYINIFFFVFHWLHFCQGAKVSDIRVEEVMHI